MIWKKEQQRKFLCKSKSDSDIRQKIVLNFFKEKNHLVTSKPKQRKTSTVIHYDFVLFSTRWEKSENIPSSFYLQQHLSPWKVMLFSSACSPLIVIWSSRLWNVLCYLCTCWLWNHMQKFTMIYFAVTFMCLFLPFQSIFSGFQYFSIVKRTYF